MDGNWFSNGIQAVLANWVSEGFVIAVGAVATYLKKQQSPWFVPVCWGLAASLCTAFILYLGQTIITQQKPQVTPDDVQAYIQEWERDTGTGIRDITGDNPDDIFTMQLSLMNGTSIIVRRPKVRSRYLLLDASIGITDPHEKAVFQSLSPDERAEFLRSVVIEMNRSRIECSAQPALDGTVRLRKTLLISSVTNDSFLQSTQDMNFAVALAIATMQQEFVKSSSAKRQGAPH
jgi:hypothetical protein